MNSYQWYPGHMTKAMRMMQEDLKLVDLIIEVIDARIPRSSRNPDIDTLAAGRSRLLLLNKADLADPDLSRLWTSRYSSEGIAVMETDSRSSRDMNAVRELIRSVTSERVERDRRRGIVNRPVRAMVAGIPNVGKSTLINRLTGKSAAKTGNKPGVTRGKQWISLGRGLQLMDTPGLLWPRFEDEQTGRNLAFIGSLNDNNLELTELAQDLLDYLRTEYPAYLRDRYGAGTDLSLEGIALAKNLLRPGSEADISRAASMLLDDMRSGRLGRVTLEYPPAL